jgi:hypothetical protein
MCAQLPHLIAMLNRANHLISHAAHSVSIFTQNVPPCTRTLQHLKEHIYNVGLTDKCMQPMQSTPPRGLRQPHNQASWHHHEGEYMGNQMQEYDYM